jgi:uncharacterized protein YjbI with pentapeptide repeats
MDTLDQLREAALRNLPTGSDPEAIDKAIEQQRTLAETLKLQAEASNTDRLAKADNRRFSLTILASLLGALAVLLGLGPQACQIVTNARLQREANDATNLREALKLIASDKPREEQAGSIVLTSLLHSSSQATTARTAVLTALTNSPDEESFDTLLQALADTTTWLNLGDLVDLQHRLLTAIWRASHPSGVAVDNARVTLLQNRELRLETILVSFLNNPHGKPPACAINLADVTLSDKDLSKLDLRGAILTRASLNNCTLNQESLERADVTYVDLKEATLDNVARANGSKWYATAWWRAASMHPLLVEYLASHYQLNPAVLYRIGDQYKKQGRVDYDDGVRHLLGRAPLSQTPPPQP